MKMSVVIIRPRESKAEKWEVIFYDLEGDRVNETKGPTSLLSYCYPRKLGMDEAFSRMKSFIISKYEEEIEYLKHRLESLKRLQMPEVDKKGAADG